jgi:hypothetical protein
MLWMQWMQVLLGYFPWQLTVDEASLSSFPAIAIFCLWLRHRVKRYAVISTCACLLTKNVECPPHMISGHLHIFFAEILPFYLGCLPSFWWFSQVLHILNTISLSEVTCRCVLTFSVLPFHIFFFFPFHNLLKASTYSFRFCPVTNLLKKFLLWCIHCTGGDS